MYVTVSGCGYFVEVNPESITDPLFVLLQHLLQLLQLVQPVPPVLLRAPAIVALEPVTDTSYDLHAESQDGV